MRLGWNSYLGFRADSTQECSQSNQFLLLHWISRFTHKYVTFPKQMGCKANSELTSARGLFVLQKWLQSVSSVHCSNTDHLVTPTLQSPNYSPRKVPPAPTQHPLRTLSTRRSRRETSGKCVTGRLPKGGTHFRLSSLTTPDNLFSLNKFQAARAVPFCKKRRKT